MTFRDAAKSINEMMAEDGFIPPALGDSLDDASDSLDDALIRTETYIEQIRRQRDFLPPALGDSLDDALIRIETYIEQMRRQRDFLKHDGRRMYGRLDDSGC